VINTIMPGEGRFLVGTRSFAIGERIPITFRGKPIQVEVTKVTAREIAFRNTTSGEIAVRKMDFMPVGMSAGNHGISAPGMIEDGPNAPLDLDNLSPETPQKP
jgi:hypothetical protein